MTGRSESPVQIMALIAKHRKIAEIKFDPLDPAIDHILKDGITFENDVVKLLSCRVLDPAVPLVQLRLSNLPFLKEEILKEQLKRSLKPYGSVLDLGILRKSHTGTYVGTGYAILSSEDKGFYAVWSDVPTYCRYCHAEGHTVPDCPKKRSSYVCWNCRASVHIAAERAKSKNKPFKRLGKLLLSHRTESIKYVGIRQDGKGSVVDECGRPEPMDCIVNEEQYRLETLSSHTQYLSKLHQEENNETQAMQIEDDVKVVTDVAMREMSIKRNYKLYTDQDRLRLLKLLLDKCLSASAAAKRLSIHVRAAQRWTKQYNKDPDRLQVFKSMHGLVKVPKTRALTTIILGAISAAGLIKCSLRLPFLKDTMDEMDQYPHIKGHYLVMDNALIHISENIAKYIASRGYRCAYRPSYSPELSPIEQFWSVVKSKVKPQNCRGLSVIISKKQAVYLEITTLFFEV
ncbi:hypothetical protein G6F57_001094 [Rhizopus arrhizus]|uniref:Tc1-like transposase DDE domain-containing protein n=1 Tax=Rhizopus oryzae TaxID=64495 RepID=A0A9P6XF68_RHIOR|nr:hypothetical protein G6F21_005942 [Rhizopus arrhizus]KAG1423188.1 hypothetical protein G6F58_002935 [Rhizopus delemar]KAG0811992.1 hypothetical protein G6F20_006717 [Rhizopus arrhizus]KAG0831181.1 hypothetical protein G6F19_006866 [Rhizopus arrhizus]KAG0832978.1 hypothetical protein G6F18_006973 [Rhizopus arrhizus]